MTVPALRREDVTREIDLIEEVARIDGVERLPATLPARRGAAGMLSHAQRVRRAAEDALVGRGLYEIVGWSFADPGLLDRLRLPAGHRDAQGRRDRKPALGAQSILRPTLLGSLLDAARHNVARNRPDIAIFESGTVYRAGVPQGRAADEHHALGALLTGAAGAAPPGAASPREADFFAAKALLGALLEQARRRSWSVEPAGLAVPSPRPQRRRARRPGRGWGSSASSIPLVAGAWDLARTAAFASTSASSPRRARRSSRSAPSRRFPRCGSDLAVIAPETVSAAQALERVRPPAGEMLDDVGVFDVYTGAQVGEGTALAGAVAVIQLGRAHAHRRGHRSRCARASCRRSASSGVSSVAEHPRAPERAAARSTCRARRACSSPARPDSRARSPPTCSGATRASSSSPSPGARRSAGASTSSIRATACRSRSRSSTSTRSPASTRRSSPIPHAAAAPTVAALRERGVRVVDLSADFRLSSLATYEQWYGEHPARSCSRRPSTGSPSCTASGSPAPGSSPTPAATRPPSCSLSRRSRGPGLIADVVIDAKQGISGAGRTFDETTHLSMAGENILPYNVARHRHTPEIEEQLAAQGAISRSSSRRISSRSTRASSPAATSRRRARYRAEELERALRGRLSLTSRSSSSSSAPPGTREVAQTNFCRLFAAADGHTGKRDRALRDRQPLEGHLLAGDPEPQRDVLPARGRGDS